MEFGQTEDIDKIDFTLHADPAITAVILRKNRKIKNPKIFSGCAKWGKKEWVGKFYPEGTKELDFLAHYAKHFNCIELNATHYRIHPATTIKKWKDTVGNDFKFCPKFPQTISHINRLINSEKETEEFLKSIMHFDEKLGPCFLQLPPTFTPKSF